MAAAAAVVHAKGNLPGAGGTGSDRVTARRRADRATASSVDSDTHSSGGRVVDSVTAGGRPGEPAAGPVAHAPGVGRTGARSPCGGRTSARAASGGRTSARSPGAGLTDAQSPVVEYDCPSLRWWRHEHQRPVGSRPALAPQSTGGDFTAA